MGPDVCKLIKDIEEDPTKIVEINVTLITLISKTMVNLKSLRPISLCNVSYKIIIKALAQRLQSLIEGLIKPN